MHQTMANFDGSVPTLRLWSSHDLFSDSDAIFHRRWGDVVMLIASFAMIERFCCKKSHHPLEVEVLLWGEPSSVGGGSFVVRKANKCDRTDIMPTPWRRAPGSAQHITFWNQLLSCCNNSISCALSTLHRICDCWVATRGRPTQPQVER